MTDLELTKQLRAETGAYIQDCRAALECTNYDLEEAKALLRRQGTVHGLGHSLQTEARLRAIESRMNLRNF
jgi:translation elongation factor EF-Ts